MKVRNRYPMFLSVCVSLAFASSAFFGCLPDPHKPATDQFDKPGTRIGPSKRRATPVRAVAGSSSSLSAKHPGYRTSVYPKGPLGAVFQAKPVQLKPGSVYKIGQLPMYTPPLAKGEGRELVQQYCTVCHSTSYITMQPPHPPSMWKKEVHKMIKTYGATIPNDVAKKIIAYLAAHYTPKAREKAYKARFPKGGKQSATLAYQKQSYTKLCSTCHRDNGGGIPGAFPPLKGHIPVLVKQPVGKQYIAQILVYGLPGPTKIKGKTYTAPMPPVPSKDDKEIAAAINYALHAWGNTSMLPKSFVNVTAKDIAQARKKQQTAKELRALRAKLGL